MTPMTEELDEALLDLVGRWHAGEARGTDLIHFLGMTGPQYEAFVHGRDLPGEYRVPERARPEFAGKLESLA